MRTGTVFLWMWSEAHIHLPVVSWVSLTSFSLRLASDFMSSFTALPEHPICSYLHIFLGSDRKYSVSYNKYRYGKSFYSTHMNPDIGYDSELVPPSCSSVFEVCVFQVFTAKLYMYACRASFSLIYFAVLTTSVLVQFMSACAWPWSTRTIY